MAVELGKFTQELPQRLPADHRDRKFIEGFSTVVESYNALDGKEAKGEIERFSPEDRKVLEGKGFCVYGLTGQSIKSLREAGKPVGSNWHIDHPEFEALTSRISEVAVNPEKLFLPYSSNKTLDQQERMVAEFSDGLAKEARGTRAIIGEAADYLELFFTHLDATGICLFGKKYGFNYARTRTTIAGSFVADVGNANLEFGPNVNLWNRDNGNDRVFAAPLVVPA